MYNEWKSKERRRRQTVIKKNQTLLNWINRLTDAAIIFAAYFAAVGFWIFLLAHNASNISVRIAAESRSLLLAICFGIILIFQIGGMYRSFRTRTLLRELLELLRLFLLCMGLIIGGIYLCKLSDFSRGVLLSFAFFAYSGLCAKRVILRLALRYARKRGYNQKHTLLVGYGPLAEKYLSGIGRDARLGYRCIGYVSDRQNPKLGENLGGYGELEGVIERTKPDEVILALERDEAALADRVIPACEASGVRVSLIPIYNDYLSDRAEMEVLGSVKLINFRAIPLDLPVNRAVKRCADLLLSGLALLLGSPLLLAIAVAVRLSGPGPILFRQTRVGMNGKDFVMYKFRSMVQNSDSDTAWSGASDSRVTRVGAWIRKFSLDELPQCFNILRGDMSIVGPRPELPYYVQRFRGQVPRYMVKHQVKPGLTGWAQVNGYRGDTSIEKRIEHDIWYIENWSPLLDVRIILMTAFGGMINREKNLSKRGNGV